MSIKKAITLSFLLLANIILLAHAAVPHHHHETISICFCDMHGTNCEETCTHEHHDTQTTHHEQHEFPSSDDCCYIDTFYAPTHNNLKTSCHLHEKCECGKMILYALISTSIYTSDFVEDTIIHFRQNPCVQLFYSDFISQSIGLRAPPACWFSPTFLSNYFAVRIKQDRELYLFDIQLFYFQ